MKNDVKPVYLKLRDVIAAAILDGKYKEGEMLPSVRAFAAIQGANPLTVAKAYLISGQWLGGCQTRRGLVCSPRSYCKAAEF